MARSTTPKDNVAAFRASMDYIANHDGLQPERSIKTKPCIKCREEKPETEFYLFARGYPWRSNVCKVCHCAQSLAALRRRRDRLLTDTSS